MAYALKLDGRVIPLTGLMDPRAADRGRPQHGPVRAGRRHRAGRVHAVRDQSLAASRRPRSLRDLLCCLPQVAVPDGLGYANVFRLMIVQFIDALLVRRALGEEDLRPHRPPGRAADPVRHLQPVLPRRPRADAPGAAAAAARASAVDARGRATVADAASARLRSQARPDAYCWRSSAPGSPSHVLLLALVGGARRMSQCQGSPAAFPGCGAEPRADRAGHRLGPARLWAARRVSSSAAERPAWPRASSSARAWSACCSRCCASARRSAANAAPMSGKASVPASCATRSSI